MPRMRVFHRGLILVGVPLLLNFTLIFFLGLLLVQSDNDHRQERRYRNLTAESGDIYRLAYEAPLTLYVALQTQEPALFKLFDKDIEQLRTRGFATLEQWKNDPILRPKMDSGREALSNLMYALDSLSQARKAGGLIDLLSNVKVLQNRMITVKDQALNTFSDFQSVGFERTQLSQTQQETMRIAEIGVLIVGIILNYLVGIFMFRFYQNGIRKRLSTIQLNTEQLSEGAQLSAPLNGSDEIAQLDQSVHHMADELKQASERERALFNNASDVICVLDEHNRFEQINPASLRLWGFSADDLLGRSLLQGVPPRDREHTLAAIQSAREVDGAVTFESRIMTRSGKHLETLWSVYWSDSARSLYCVVHDISDRKQAERAKKQFLQMITSDLKIPLASISSAIEALLANLVTSLPGKARDKLGTAKKNVQRLLGLVNDLLQFTEFDTTTLELHKKKCPIIELFTRAAQDVEGVASKQQVSIEIQNRAYEWTVDPDRIMQVLVNLLSNAIKFSPASSKVTLSAEILEDMIEIKVIDQGRGVPESHKEAIFEKFKQVDAADGKRKAGTGLGLPICKQIVEEHGGAIGVDSEEGKGSTFWFRIPVKERAAARTMRTNSRAKGRETQRIKAARQSRKREATRKNGKPKAQLKLIHKGAVLIGTPILFGTILSGTIAVLLFQTTRERARELHERQIATCTSSLLQEYLRIGSTIVTNRTPQGWDDFKQAVAKTRQFRARLEELVQGDPVAMANFEKLRKPLETQERYYQRAEMIMASGPFSKRLIDSATADSNRLIPNVLVMVHRLHNILSDAQVKEFVHPEVQEKLRNQQALVLGIGLASNILLSVLLAAFFSKDLTSRLRILAENADKLAQEEELHPAQDGTDEIAQLDQTFHITAQKLIESRHKERAVFDNSQDVICALDGRGSFLSANPATMQMWKYPAKELIGVSVIDLIPEEDREQARAQLLPKSRGARNFESRVITKDGTPAWVLWSVSKSPEDGHIYCIANDISKRKELEQLKQDFLAVVSHDLRTPLTSVTGVAKLVSAGAFGEIEEAPQQVLASITKNCDKLLELINDILDIEKLEAGQMTLQLESVSLSELLQKSISSVRSAKPEHPVQLLTTPNVAIKADKDRLVQALTNIVGHAVEWSHGAAVTVDVRNERNGVEIKIKDAAATLTETMCIQMFDRFREAIGERSARAGTGLALPIAKKIVESHGGSVQVFPVQGGGNEYIIKLPIEATLAPAPARV